MKRRVVDGAHWSAVGIGRMQLPIVAQAALLGGNVRVGLEDNLYLEKGVLGTNEQLVDQAVSILNSVKLEPMTAAEAREHLNLKKFNS